MILQLQKKVENYPNPSVSRGPTDGTARARGVTAEQVGREKCSPTPTMEPQATVASWPTGSTTLLVLLRCNFTRAQPHKTSIRWTKQVGILRKAVSALWEGHGMSPLLLSRPGTWAARRVPIAAPRVHKEAPEGSSAPSSLRCPPAGVGVHSELGAPEGPHCCQRRRHAVPLVPTRGPLAAASMGRSGMPLCNQDTAARLPTNLGQTLPPTGVVWSSSLALLPADFLVEGLHPHPPTHDLCGPPELKGQQHPCVSFTKPALPGVIREDTHKCVVHSATTREPHPSFGHVLKELRKATRMNSLKNILFKKTKK